MKYTFIYLVIYSMDASRQCFSFQKQKAIYRVKQESMYPQVYFHLFYFVC